MSPEEPCPICGSDASMSLFPEGKAIIRKFECPRCDLYDVPNENIGLLMNAFQNERQRANASGWLRENRRSVLSPEQIDRLKVLPTPTVGEKAAKLLRHYIKTSPNPGTPFHASIQESAEIARAWATDAPEMQYLIKNYMVEEIQWLEYVGGPSISSGAFSVMISPKGWAWFEETGSHAGPGRTIFVAMWFDDEVRDGREAIGRAIGHAGYEPVFIDEEKHNDLIDNRILADIRRSRLIVADFTGHRGGAFFEAGFAMGLSLPVIRSCRMDWKRDLHFDVNHYPITFWERDKLEKFESELVDSIVAVAGVGPLANP